MKLNNYCMKPTYPCPVQNRSGIEYTTKKPAYFNTDMW